MKTRRQARIETAVQEVSPLKKKNKPVKGANSKKENKKVEQPQKRVKK